MRRWLMVAVVTAMVVLAIAAAVMLQPGVPVQVSTVERGEIREYIDEQGKTRVPRIYRITTPQTGRIEEIAWSEGDSVEQGEVLARIVTEDLENEVAEARAVVERLEAAMIENDDVAVEKSLGLQAAEFVQSMNKTVEAAQAQVEASAKRAEYAETQLGRARDLREARAAAEDELDRAELQYWEGQIGFRQDSLTAEALKSIRAATALLPQMVTDYIARKGLTRAVLEKQKSEAQARLRQVLIRRERGTMRSPVDGVVLERAIRDEQYLPAGTELLTVGQLDALQVEADVLSQDVVRIDKNDPVEIYGPAIGGGLGQGVPGSVAKVYPAGFTKISSLGVEQQRVKVLVQLAPEQVELLRQREVGVEYRVRVRIFTRRQADALLVPRSALFRGPAGHWQLFVAVAKRAMLRKVEVGLMNDRVAGITSGLAEGDRVILAP